MSTSFSSFTSSIGEVDMSRNQQFLSISPEQLLGRPLNEIEEKYAPKALYVATSNGIPIPKPRTAIIGSRKASEEGRRAAAEISSHLAKKGVVIISGLAEGIDTAAHMAAIKVGGKTVAVLGTPLNKYYPAKNAQLQETIMRDHWLVSEFPEGFPTTPKSFVIRNRTMALISDASIIMEASETSGSLHQGWETLRLGRPLFLWTTIVRNSSLQWPRKMIQYGAIELEDVEQIFDVLPSSERILKILS